MNNPCIKCTKFWTVDSKTSCKDFCLEYKKWKEEIKKKNNEK